MSNFLIYINENRVIRSIPLVEEEHSLSFVFRATPTERYIITGLILGGKKISTNEYNFIDLNLKPLEIFMFEPSNLRFNITPDDYRVENVEFIFEIAKDSGPVKP